MEIVTKLTEEIQNFTLIQFLAVLIGWPVAMYFFTQARQGAESNFLAAVLTAILTLMVVGLCNFNIHRNGGYLENSLEVSQQIRNYEEAKGSHATTKFVVPIAMAVLFLPLAYIGIAGYVGGLDFYPSVLYRIGIPVLGLLAVLLYIFGAWLGRQGWQSLPG